MQLPCGPLGGHGTPSARWVIDCHHVNCSQSTSHSWAVHLLRQLCRAADHLFLDVQELDETPMWSRPKVPVDKTPLAPTAVYLIHLLTAAIYLALTLAVVVGLLQLDTALTAERRGRTFGVHATPHQLSFAVVVLCSLLSFFNVRGSNPGFLRRSGGHDDPEMGLSARSASMPVSESGSDSKEQAPAACGLCGAEQEVPTKHCLWCDR